MPRLRYRIPPNKSRFRSSRRKLTDSQVCELRRLKRKNPRMAYAPWAKKYGCTAAAIHQAIIGATYADVPCKPYRKEGDIPYNQTGE